MRSKFVIWAIANPQIAMILAGAVAALITLTIATGIWLWAFHQTDSKAEKKADDARVQTIGDQANSNVAEIPVIETRKASKQAGTQVIVANQGVKAAKKRTQAAEANVEQAKQPVSNVSYTAANKLRCQAYPEDCK